MQLFCRAHPTQIDTLDMSMFARVLGLAPLAVRILVCTRASSGCKC